MNPAGKVFLVSCPMSASPIACPSDCPSDDPILRNVLSTFCSHECVVCCQYANDGIVICRGQSLDGTGLVSCSQFVRVYDCCTFVHSCAVATSMCAASHDMQVHVLEGGRCSKSTPRDFPRVSATRCVRMPAVIHECTCLCFHN